MQNLTINQIKPNHLLTQMKKNGYQVEEKRNEDNNLIYATKDESVCEFYETMDILQTARIYHENIKYFMESMKEENGRLEVKIMDDQSETVVFNINDQLIVVRFTPFTVIVFMGDPDEYLFLTKTLEQNTA